MAANLYGWKAFLWAIIILISPGPWMEMATALAYFTSKKEACVPRLRAAAKKHRSKESSSDEELVRSYRTNGDLNARELLASRFIPFAESAAFRISKDWRIDFDDLLEAGLEGLRRGIEKWPLDSGTDLSAYLRAAIANRMRNAVREAKFHQRFFIPFTHFMTFEPYASIVPHNLDQKISMDRQRPTPASQAERDEERQLIEARVRKALDLLSPAQRMIIQSYYIDGMSQAAIAASLNISENTLKQRAWAIRRQLAKFLEN